jgi:hypothetical protein
MELSDLITPEELAATCVAASRATPAEISQVIDSLEAYGHAVRPHIPRESFGEFMTGVTFVALAIRWKRAGTA